MLEHQSQGVYTIEFLKVGYMYKAKRYILYPTPPHLQMLIWLDIEYLVLVSLIYIQVFSWAMYISLLTKFLKVRNILQLS